MNWGIPGLVVLGTIRKQVDQVMKNQVSKQQPFIIFASVPASRFLS